MGYFSTFCIALLLGNSTNFVCNYPIHTTELTDIMDFGFWMYDHNKTYTQEEIGNKYYNWEKNIKIIDEHNAGNHGFTLDLNQFADISQTEWFMRRNKT